MNGEPVIPPPREDDDDDVAWALQTAAVQWERGSFAEAVVWVKRAVDAAITTASAARTKELTRAASLVAERAAQAAADAEQEQEQEAEEIEEIEIDEVDEVDEVEEAAGASRAAAPTLSNEMPVDVDAALPRSFPPPRRAPPPPRERAGASSPPPDAPERDADDIDGSVRPPPLDASEAIRRSLLSSEPPPPLDDSGDAEAVLSVRAPRSRGLEGLEESAAQPSALDDEPVTETMAVDDAKAVAAELGDGLAERESDVDAGSAAAIAESGELGDPLEEPPELPPSEPPASEPASERPASEPPELPSSEPPASEPIVPAAEPAPESLDFADEESAPEAAEARPSDVPNEAPETVDLRDRLGLDLEFPDDEGPLTSPPPAPARSEFPPMPSAPPPAVAATGGDDDEGRATVDGVFLDQVRGFEDLPEDGQARLAELAQLERLSVEEEVGSFGAALVTRGSVGIMPAIADVAAGIARAGDVVFTNGSVEEGVSLRVVALEDGTTVASWKGDVLESAFADCPWVIDELKEVADRFQALAGATLGDLGDRLDDSLRAIVTDRLEVRVLEPGDVLVEQGKPVPGLVIVGAGRIELVQDEETTDELGPGDFVFAAEVMSAGAATATARAGKGGALLLYASRATAHELLVSVPPLLEILAG